jgi:CBS domain-containing protein
MSRHGVSSLLVNEGDAVCGIVTDRDLRNRVLAPGRDPTEPVSAIMTAEPLTLDAASPVLEGILAMAARGIHHCVDREERVVGMLTTVTDDARPSTLVSRRADPKAGSIEARHGVRAGAQLFELLLASGMRAEQVPKS